MERFKGAINKLIFIKDNYPLSKSSTLSTSGSAELYAEPKNINELMDILEIAYAKNIKISILGAGTHTLITDGQAEGLVISTRSMQGLTMKGTLLECYPGEMLERIIDKAIEHQLVGLEKLAGIPGTIGGAITSNAEANGCAISDFVYYFDYITYSGRIKRQPNYNDTFSKQKLNMTEDGIIVNVALRLNPSKATAEAKIRKRMYVELMFIPPCANYLGQVFRDTKDISAAKTIKALGLDRLNGIAEFSEYQPNCIFTQAGCKASDVYNLIVKAEKLAKTELNIQLERSLTLLGQFKTGM